MRRSVILAVMMSFGLVLAGPVAADELPQAPQWVDELPEVEVPASGPEAGTLEEAPRSDLVAPDGGLSGLGWLLVLVIFLVFVVPGWAILAGLGLFGATGIALVRRAKDRRLSREIDAGLRLAAD